MHVIPRRRTLVVALALFAPVFIWGAPSTLAPGDTISAPGPDSISGTQVASELNDFTLTTPSGNSLTGKLGSYVLAGSPDNPYGGLTFVYELKNTGSFGDEGLTLLSLAGFGGLQLSVTQGDSLQFSPGDPQLAGEFSRSGGAGDSISISFPEGGGAPPIFTDQSSFQLVVFTDAQTWTDTTSQPTVTNFRSGDSSSGGVQAITPHAAAVPDGGSTIALSALALAGVFALRRRTRRSKE